MTTYIALLRAVNLAGINKVSMSDLRELAAALDLQDARTLLQSGNLVFRSTVSSAEKLERLLQDAAARELSVSTEFFVRSAAEWSAVIEANPFPAEAKSDPGHLLVMALKDAPPHAAVAALQSAIKGREIVRAKGRQAFITYPDGVGRSKLTVKMIEQKLGTRGTARNWNTVLKLAAMAGEK
ncbi:MAG TPA: DUF1697 domain-containing protein [Vicinamibacterales bacterium]|nr:DUF1697 domain-containing protein [Vicinamibacterales bacterium]